MFVATCLIIVLSSLCLCTKACDVEKEYSVDETTDEQVSINHSVSRPPPMLDKDLSAEELMEYSTYDDDDDDGD